MSLDVSTRERLTAAHKDAAAIYPLTSAQQELLVHAVAFPRSPLGVLQFSMNVTGPIRADALRRSWQRLVDRHESLRTSFTLENPAEPLQVVHRGVTARWEEHDWSTLPLDDYERRLAQHLAADRGQPLDHRAAPLLRCALIHGQDRAASFVITFHHLVLDGWSFSLLLRELDVIYRAELKGVEPAMPPAPSLRAYMSWLTAQDPSHCRQFWRTALAGFRPRRLLGAGAPPAAASEVEEVEHHLPADLTQAITAFAHDAEVTLVSVVEAAWALLLNGHGAGDDVVFGVTVAGRPAAVVGIERAVGMFTNVLPLRLPIDRTAPVKAWLTAVQRRQLDLRDYEHSSRALVHEAAGVPVSVPLFETALVFQEHEVDDGAAAERGGDSRSSHAIGIRTGAPLTLVINPGVQLGFRVSFQPHRVDAGIAREVVPRLERVLASLVCRRDARVGDVEVPVGREPGAAHGTPSAVDVDSIERVLRAHDVVADVAVLAPSGGDRRRILAYVVPKAGITLAVPAMRRIARQHLPPSMVPSDYVVLATLPRLADGEIDRTALPSPESQQSVSRVLMAGSASYDILEFQLARIWEDVFGLSPIAPEDNFFDLGGDSLIGLALVTRIKTALSYDLPLSALLHGATIRDMAVQLRRETGATAWASLVPIRTTGRCLPFFCVHPIGGNVLAFVDLVRHVDADYPFYALQSIGLDGRVEPYSTVEEMAAHYLEDIRGIQPQGPYRLGGVSFGGLVAFELARQLEQQGAPVDLVALVDMECPLFEGRAVFKEAMAADDATLIRQSSLALREHYTRRPEQMRELDGLESQALVARVLEHLGVRGPWYENARRVFTILLHGSRALRDFMPGPYSGTITIFRSTESAGAAQYAQLLQAGREQPEAMLAWRARARGVELIDVPGDHVTMLAEPHVRTLARKLSDCLALADRAHAVSPAAATS